MDVCAPQAIEMRRWRARTPEGSSLMYRALRSKENREAGVAEMMSFPYLAQPERCDGCGECGEQCPVGALSVFSLPAVPVSPEWQQV
jgi:ferredoxin